MKLEDCKKELTYNQTDANICNAKIPPNTKIGKLTVVGYYGSASEGKLDSRVYYQCKCECGNPDTLIFTLKSLFKVISGERKTISCGCAKASMIAILRKPVKNKYGKESGAVKHYRSIRARCYQKTHKKYLLYGGRGIKMCPEWEDAQNGVNNFCDWLYNEAGFTDDMGPEVSVDRIDNDLDYCPTNCRLSYNRAQSNNKNQNSEFVWYGERYNLREISELFGKKPDGTGSRIREGKPLHEVLRSPLFESKIDRQNYLAQFPLNQIPHIPFVIEPFHFVDHSEIGLMDRYRLYEKPVENITMELTARNYRLQLIAAGLPAIKPFQITNSGSDEFLLEGNSKTFYHVRGIKEDLL